MNIAVMGPIEVAKRWVQDAHADARCGRDVERDAMTVEDQAGPSGKAAAQPAGSRRPVSLVLAADHAAPARAREALAEFAAAAGADQAGIDAIRLVVSELVANVVTHAYDGAAGNLQITAALLPRAVAIEISDDGRGPDGPSPRPGLGAGWRIVRTLAERFTVGPRSGGGTLVLVSMPLIGRAPEATARRLTH
jgi:anti-sigma regulatory factor (Ser/Thr protein kinase)